MTCSIRVGARAANPVGTPLPGSSLALGRIGGLLRGEALGLDLLCLFQTQQQLVDGQALCPAAEAVALQFLDDLAQSLVLCALRREHRRLKRDRIVGQWLGRIGHKADSTMHSNALPVRWPFLESTCPTGERVSRASCTRRQSNPSRSACNCAAVNLTTPSVMAGQQNFPSSRRFTSRHTPVPSKYTSLTRSARFALKT